MINFYKLFIIVIILYKIKKKWGIGDWGWGIGDWGLGPIPNPQSPIPNPHINFFLILYKIITIINNL